jgi:hypothetical protein
VVREVHLVWKAHLNRSSDGRHRINLGR